MGDLIRRSDLLKKFNNSGIQITFDLPVEEVLGEDVDIDDFTMLVQDAIQAYKNMVIGTIKDMPTAYDVEKVVAELETMEEKAIKVKNITVSAYACGMMHKAIDIVKKGGVE